MDVEDFDAWRRDYDSMSFLEQKEFYGRVYSEHPVQEGWRLGESAVYRFLDETCKQYARPLYLTELGGWDGGLARLMLDHFPRIALWLNIDICEQAIMASPSMARYATWVPSDFPWKVRHPPCDILLASHFIEHIKMKNLWGLLDVIPEGCKHIGLLSPLPDSGFTNWSGYLGTHILEVGWSGVKGSLSAHGFKLVFADGNFVSMSR